MTNFWIRDHYALFVPRHEPPPEGWPIMLFLHGAGERGTDVHRVTQVGLGPRIEQNEADFPCIVVMPQCLPEHLWVHPDMADRALLSLDAACEQFRPDRSRIYLTGMSMGGFGAWWAAYRQPQRFAALITVCGGFTTEAGSVARQAAVGALRTMPIWSFHGTHDDIIPVTETRSMVAELTQAGSDIRYTEYEDLKHNSWDRAYAEAELWPWLFNKKLTHS